MADSGGLILPDAGPPGTGPMPGESSGGGAGEWLSSHKGLAIAIGVVALVGVYFVYSRSKSSGSSSSSTGSSNSPAVYELAPGSTLDTATGYTGGYDANGNYIGADGYYDSSGNYVGPNTMFGNPPDTSTTPNNPSPEPVSSDYQNEKLQGSGYTSGGKSSVVSQGGGTYDLVPNYAEQKKLVQEKVTQYYQPQQGLFQPFEVGGRYIRQIKGGTPAFVGSWAAEKLT